MEKVHYRIIESRSGLPTVLVSKEGKEFPLHSAVDPSRDKMLFQESLDPSRYDVVIILGMGIGYHLVPLLNDPDRYRLIVIIERIEGFERVVSPEIADFMSRDNVVLIAGSEPATIQEMLASYFSMEDIRGIQVLEHPASVRLFGEYYSGVRASITHLIDRKAGSAAARRAFGLRYFRNGIANLTMTETCKPVIGLRDLYVDRDAVVVTSGPGLERVLEPLKKYQDCVVVIAVDSALPVLVSAGVRADYCIAVDPQPYISEHLMGIPDCTDLILSVTAYGGLSRLLKTKGGYSGGIYLALNSHPLGQIVEELYPDSVGILESRTGNVAGDAVLLALVMGFRRIALAGFDFSFPGRRIYARGTAYQKRYSMIFNNRFRSVETSNMGYIRQGGSSRYEEGVLTRRSFIQYRDSLHDMILRQQGAFRLFHIRAQGLSIDGIEALTPLDFFRDMKPLEDKDDLRVRARKISPPAINPSILENFLLRPEIFLSLMDESIGQVQRQRRERLFYTLIRRLTRQDKASDPVAGEKQGEKK